MTLEESKKRRVEILKLKAKGLTQYDISVKLGIQPALVNYYLKSSKHVHLETTKDTREK